MSDGEFSDKVVLVTGGASGIGKATVGLLARAGAKLAFTDLDVAAGQTVSAELRQKGAEVLFIQSDATMETDAEGMVARTVEHYGRLDIAINNVGGTSRKEIQGQRLHEVSREAWEETVALNHTAAFFSMKHEIAQMLRQGGGIIANTVSMAAFSISGNSSAAYVSGKAGLVQLTRYAAIQYAKDNIRINAVAPGLTSTPAVMQSFPDEERRDAIAAAFHPMGRMVTAEEVGNAFLWLCSPQASGVTGMTIPVAGGWNAR